MSYCGTLYTIAGPSGVGKSSLVSALQKAVSGMQISISCTTRLRQLGEADHAHYHFVAPAEFQKMADNGDFLEHATVFGHHYGTPRHWVESTLAAADDVILEIDWQGALQVQQQVPDSVAIFILPPDVAALLHRLTARGRDDGMTIERRLTAARQEILRSDYADYLVINDNFEQALQSLQAIVLARRLQYKSQRCRQQSLFDTLTGEDVQPSADSGGGLSSPAR